VDFVGDAPLVGIKRKEGIEGIEEGKVMYRRV
jgi:hypothetical protein